MHIDDATRCIAGAWRRRRSCSLETLRLKRRNTICPLSYLQQAVDIRMRRVRGTVGKSRKGTRFVGGGQGGREVECGGRKRVSSTILIRDVRAFCVWEEEEEEEGVGKLTQ